MEARWLNEFREAVGTNTQFENPLAFQDREPHFPFEIYREGTVAKIFGGRWTRNGIILSIVTQTLTLATGSLNFVFLELDNDKVPTTLTLKVNTSGLPAETGGENRRTLIGTVTTTAGDEITQNFNDWKGGDIDNQSHVPTVVDHDSPNSGTDPYRSSIEKNPQAGVHKDELQLFNLHGVAKVVSPNEKDGRPFCLTAYQSTNEDARGDLKWIAPDADAHNDLESNLEQRSIQIVNRGVKNINGTLTSGGGALQDYWLQLYGWLISGGFALDRAEDHILVRDHDGGGADGKPWLEYSTPAQIGNSILPGDLNGGGGIVVGDIGDINNGTVIHGFLGFGSGPHPVDPNANSDRSQDGRYWYATSVATEDGGVTGGASAKDYFTEGEVRAAVFSIIDATANSWDKDNLTASVTDSIIMLAGGDGPNTILISAIGGTSPRLVLFSDDEAKLHSGFETNVYSEAETGLVRISNRSGGGQGTNRIELNQGGDMTFLIGNGLAIDGFLTLDTGTIHHGNITAQLLSIAPVAGGLAGMLVAFDGLVNDLRANGYMA